MIAAILMCESLILTTGFRILIRNFIPDTLQRAGGNPCKPCGTVVFPYDLISKYPSEVSLPPRTTWILPTQKSFSVFLLMHKFFFWRRKNLSLDFHCLTVPARVLFIFFKNQKIFLGEELFLKVPRGRTLKVSERSCLDGLRTQSVGCSQPLDKDQENSSSTQLQLTSEQRF